MLRSIILTAFQTILRNKSFSFINLFGLSISMSLGLLIIFILHEQYSFDNFHRDADRIFHVNTRALRVDGGNESYESAPLPIERAIKENFNFELAEGNPATALAEPNNIVRKVVWAQRWQVFVMFVGESVVFSLIALVFSYLLMQFLKPAFSELYFAKKFPSLLHEDAFVYE